MTEKPYSLDKVAIRMVKEPPLYSSTPVRSPDDAVRLVSEMLKGYDREVFCLVNFRNDMSPINMNIVSVGTLNASIAHPRDILKSPVLSNAASVMIFHNHPSGSLEPSKEDVQVTDKLQKLFSLVEIPLLDHIIIGTGDRYYSFRENRTLPVSEQHYVTDASSEMITDIEAKLAEMEKAQELEAIPEKVPEMNADRPVIESGSKAWQTNGKDPEKASVLKELTEKKAEPKKPGHGRKKPAREEAR